jgi:starch synthase
MKGKITGILNGLDIDLWNPETDEALVKKFSVNNWLEGKRASKLSVQNETGLAVDQDRILIGFVGRLDPIQKGVGLILEAIGSENTEGRIQNTEIQFVVLGTGDPNLENQLRKAANTFENFAAVIKFDNGLARRIYAGCDFLLVPSKFEPCGLIQMIAMRYGAIPIVRNTGGLKDTVREEETGFLFPDYTMKSMMGAVSKAIDLYADHAKREQMVRNCMSEDFSWNKSAKEYVMLYEKLVMEE